MWVEEHKIIYTVKCWTRCLTSRQNLLEFPANHLFQVTSESIQFSSCGWRNDALGSIPEDPNPAWDFMVWWGSLSCSFGHFFVGVKSSRGIDWYLCSILLRYCSLSANLCSESVLGWVVTECVSDDCKEKLLEYKEFGQESRPYPVGRCEHICMKIEFFGLTLHLF